MCHRVSVTTPFGISCLTVSSQTGGVAVLRLIAQLVKPYRWVLAIILLAMLVQTGMTLLVPWPFKIIIDSVGGSHPVPKWLSWFLPMLGSGDIKMRIATAAAVLVVMIAAVTAIANFFTTYFTASIGQWIANDLRSRTYHHLQLLSLKYYHSHRVGSILSTITDDVTTIQGFASSSTVGMFIDLLTIGGMLVVMFVMKVEFALIAAAVLPFMIFFVSHVRRGIENATKEVRKYQADLVAAAEEGLEAVETEQAYVHEEIEERQLADIGRMVVVAALKARRIRAFLTPVLTIPVALCTAFIFWRGTWLFLHHNPDGSRMMELGVLQVFSVYLAKFFAPVQDLSQQADTFAQTAVAVQRIRAILDADTMIEERPDAIDPPVFRGHISLEHVAFSYDEKTPVLRDISFTVEPGDLVGIVGHAGSGKSTVIGLIARFYDADSGTITIDGVDIRDYKVHGLRSQIGFVLQDTVLFRGTIHDNIAFGRPDATREEVIEAAKNANADEFIIRMPDGYDSTVGERGMTLSGGQRQRIGIARALIRDNPILILDEPTAALDAESEHLVIEALQRLMKGRTVLCIAHRLSTLHDASKIVVIKDGVVAEQGTNEELLALNGLYADFHRIQYGDQPAQSGTGGVTPT
jgi:ABC-type multidrug transport system fused ATPase/permease subunit